MTHIGRPASESRYCDSQVRVRSRSTSVRHECQCTTRENSVGDRVECRRGRRRGHRAEGGAPDDQQSGLRCVTSGCNLDVVLLRIELKIKEIETFYITIHMIYFILGGSSNLGSLGYAKRLNGTPGESLLFLFVPPLSHLNRCRLLAITRGLFLLKPYSTNLDTHDDALSRGVEPKTTEVSITTRLQLFRYH